MEKLCKLASTYGYVLKPNILSFFTVVNSFQDVDPTIVLEWLDENKTTVDNNELTMIKSCVYYKRDRTPSFLSYMWAYNKDKIPYIGTRPCEFTFHLFISFESMITKDANLFKTLDTSRMDITNFRRELVDLFVNRGWEYIVPWFHDRYNVNLKSVLVNYKTAFTILSVPLQYDIKDLQNLDWSERDFKKDLYRTPHECESSV